MKPKAEEKSIAPIVQIYTHRILPSLPIETHVGVLVTIGKQEWYCHNSPDYNIPFNHEAYEQRFGKPDIITLSAPSPKWDHDSLSSKTSLIQKMSRFIDTEAQPQNYCLYKNNCATTAAIFLSEILGYELFDKTTVLPKAVTDTAKKLSIESCLHDLRQYCKANDHRAILYGLDDLFDKTGDLKKGQTAATALDTLNKLRTQSKRRGPGSIFCNSPSTRAIKLDTLIRCLKQQHPALLMTHQATGKVMSVCKVL